MAADVEFCLLGSLVVRCGDGAVPVLPGKQRAVLAVLLLDAGRVVPVDEIAEALWGTTPPPSARVTVRNYVKRLRQSLGDAGGARISTRPGGYLIDVDAGELDVARFEVLLGSARAAARDGSWNQAAADARGALALWRGEPLADVESEVLAAREVPRLAELRLQALEARIDADLHLGRQSEVSAELQRLVSVHPLREHLHAQLMLALYLCGRQGQALAAYQDARRVLAEELGVEPGTRLRELHRQVLNSDPALAADPATPVPAQLPPDTADFTGRDEQTRLLCDRLATGPGEGRPGVVVVSAIAGMGGIGKTTLAVHVAHQLRDRFPGGQLYASLRGATLPLRPADVLARFLRDLGLPDAGIPADEAERAARYRTLVADRAMLIVLDDARDAAQVRPLLPGTERCAVIVTSRNALHGLPGAVRLDLDVLDPGEAGALFGVIIGASRATAEPDATASVLGSCAGLPLAVRIAASRLASRPGWSIAHFSEKLADERGRLAELTAGDLAVRASFAVSYEALAAGPPDPARVFRLLGLADAAVLPLPAVTALAGQPAGEVAAALEMLTDAHLLESPTADRFRLHDLLRSYAAGLTAQTDSTHDREAAIGRMLRWYGDQAVTAAQVLTPGRRFPASALFQPAADAAEPAQALDWFEAELAGLLAAARQAIDLGLHGITVQIAVGMSDFFQRTPHMADWLATSGIGVRSARHLGDDAILSSLLNSLGQACSRTGRFADSHRYLSEALTIRQRTGDRDGEAGVLNSLAVNLYFQKRFEDALEYLRSTLAIFVALDRPRSVGLTENNIGELLLQLKRHGEAMDHVARSLAIHQETGDRHGLGQAESTLGQVYQDLGRPEDAVVHYRRSLEAFHSTARNHSDQADVLCGLGRALDSLGRTGEARDAWLTAIPILDRLADPRAAELRGRLMDTIDADGYSYVTPL